MNLRPVLFLFTTAVAMLLGDRAAAQGSSPWNLPTPNSVLEPLDSAATLEAHQEIETPLTERLPRVLEELPAGRVIPNATATFLPDQRVARLIRGNQVMEISNGALRDSGLFEEAINSSPTLARAYQEYEARTLQRMNVEYQHQRMSPPRPEADLTEEDLPPPEVLEARAAQINAAEDFERALWTVGLNGAKVARVQSLDDQSRDRSQHVLLEAIGNTPLNNLGYATTRVAKSGGLGVTTVPSEYLLPLPADSNDVFFNQVTSAYMQRAPDGLMLRLSDDTAKNPVLQLLGEPRFTAFHDSGFVVRNGKRNFAENVSLLSSRDPRAGQTFFDGGGTFEPNLNAAVNAQILDIGGGQTVQAFMTADNDVDVDELDVESFGVRAYNRQSGSAFEGWSLAAGTQQSVFGAEDWKPSGLDANRTLIGSVDRNERRLSQLAVHAPLSDYLTWKVGIEEPYIDDVVFADPMNVTPLRRWPVLATNVSWRDPDLDHRLHLGGLVRNVGFQRNATETEHFATGWGVSALAKIRTGNAATFFGLAAGQGIGDYTEGIRVSAIADTNSISTLEGTGLFAGRQMVWYDACQNPVSALNVAYGYALMEFPSLLDATVFNRKLHQGWINYTYFLSDQIGLGMEYQYGYREVGTGDVGEDHRFMVLIAARSSPPKTSTRVVAASRESGVDIEMPPPTEVLNGVPLADTTMRSNIPYTGALLDGRPLENVVDQSQLGGPAHQQGL